MPDYTVIAALDYTNPNITKFRLDFAQSTDPDDKYLVMSDFKYAVTDTMGVATFEKLSVMEV